MKYVENKVEDIKIAYIGGGSRRWARTLMSDLVAANDISGSVYLYDIDFEAAKDNEVIGNAYNDAEGANTKWNYKAVENIGEALVGADFVVISILPGTFDEMEIDVHTPEKYGIYQSVGDTAGPGGIMRALRTLPIMEKFALAIKEYCPKAWVINFTNPMTVSVRMLYKAFPEIKAFGCCHEVFGTQQLLADMLNEKYGLNIKREKIDVSVMGVNHFTWLKEAHYQNYDLRKEYEEFSSKYYEKGYTTLTDEELEKAFACFAHRIKFDLFKKYGYYAAAGDRHLVEFMDGNTYLDNPATVKSWKFGLSPVSWRKDTNVSRLQETKEMVAGKKKVEIFETKEEGVMMIRAILGLSDKVTNVNLPNVGQIANLPKGVVVETNALFRADSVIPVTVGDIPKSIFPLVERAVKEQEMMVEAAYNRDLSLAFEAFKDDALVKPKCSEIEAKELFDEMVNKTKHYLTEYFK